MTIPLNFGTATAFQAHKLVKDGELRYNIASTINLIYDGCRGNYELTKLSEM